MTRFLFIFAIFLLGFGASELLSVFSSRQPIKTSKPVELVQEATSTAVLGEARELESAVVTRVIDGDTIELSDGRKIRYIGIDTPETVDPRRAVGCFGREASAENRRLVDGKTVRLEKDISETDKYGRLLRYVYVETQMVNDALVRNGFAYASSYPPDVKYQEQFAAAQREAREGERGLWKACGESNTSNASNTSKASNASNTNSISETPSSSVSSNPSTSSPGTCTIKGNISTKGEKIFHIPGCGSYDKTAIDESAGERWFCTEDEAISAGWRKAKNC